MAEEKEGFFVRIIKSFDRRFILRHTLRSPLKTIGTAIGVFLLALMMVFFLGTEFLPPFNEGSVTINVLLPPGTSLAESNRIGAIAEKAFFLFRHELGLR